MPTPETLQAWKDGGVKKVIVRASTEDGTKKEIAHQQFTLCSEAGFEVEAYIWLYWDEPIPAQVHKAMVSYVEYDIKRWWLDCEGDTKGLEPEYVVALIRQAVDELGAVNQGIYTGRSWWMDNTNNSEEFSDLPLWDAYYTGHASMVIFYPYGGWTKAEMHQYTDKGLFGDESVYLG